MKKIYLKTALFEDQINAINKLKGEIDGVEIQLLKPSDNLDLLFKIEVPVLSIHYYLSKELDDEGWYNCDSDLELIIRDETKLQMFENVCNYADRLGCSVGIHLNCGINRLDKDKILDFVNISKKHPNVLIYIENIGLQRKSGYISNLADLQDAVYELNKLGANCDILVDTCHSKITSKLRNEDWHENIKKYIKAADENSSKSIYVHLADAIEDGAGPNHGTNFIRTDLDYLDTIMKELNNCVKDVNVVLEVNDKDLIEKPLAKELKDYIELNY